MNSIFGMIGPDSAPVLLGVGLNILNKITLVPALLFVIGAVFAWAIMIRKPGRRHPHHHHPHHWRSPRSDPEKKKSGRGLLFWRRHRRRRKELPRNPTLAETGGLPSARGTEPNPPAGLS